MRTNARYQAIDLMRGIACLMVVLDHAGVVIQADGEIVEGLDAFARMCLTETLKFALGPPMFFVMSGFCVAASIVSCQRKGIGPLTFLSRRLRRVLPPYWIALAGLAGFIALLDLVGLPYLHSGARGLAFSSPGALTTDQWIGNIFLWESWRPHFWGTHSEVYSRVAWSLCYQEQFYAVCAFVWLLAPSRFWKALAIATALILGLRVVAWDSGGLHNYEGLFPIYWHEFAVGIAVYFRLCQASTATEKRWIDAFLAVLLLVGICSSRTTAIASGFGFLLIVLHRWDDQIASIRALDVFRRCGKYSYGIYLVHLPICSIGACALHELGVTGFWTRAIVVLPLTFVAGVAGGVLFSRKVESRFVPADSSWGKELSKTKQPRLQSGLALS